MVHPLRCPVEREYRKTSLHARLETLAELGRRRQAIMPAKLTIPTYCLRCVTGWTQRALGIETSQRGLSAALALHFDLGHNVPLKLEGPGERSETPGPSGHRGIRTPNLRLVRTVFSH